MEAGIRPPGPGRHHAGRSPREARPPLRRSSTACTRGRAGSGHRPLATHPGSTKIRGVKRRDRLPSEGRASVRGRRLDVQPSMSATLTPRILVLPYTIEKRIRGKPPATCQAIRWTESAPLVNRFVCVARRAALARLAALAPRREAEPGRGEPRLRLDDHGQGPVCRLALDVPAREPRELAGRADVCFRHRFIGALLRIRAGGSSPSLVWSGPGLLRHPRKSVYGIVRPVRVGIPREKARNNTRGSSGWRKVYGAALSPYG